MAKISPQISDIEKKRHSAAHLLAMAVLELFPEAKLAIGPAIENGFYYDFDLPQALSVSDLEKLEAKMKQLIGLGLGFEPSELGIAEAIKFFEHQPYKIELIEDLEKADQTTVSLYKTSEFIDLCPGGHVKSTKEINPTGLKLTKVAGAYWRGDANRPMLQRVYGLLFDTKAELESHLNKLEEAEKRDHKKLGRELDLFTFSELVGAGLPLWTPKGAIMRDLLDDYVWQLRKEKGYEKVEIPHITKKDLYEVSGHWQKFTDELFQIKTREGHELALKPMNCPHHSQIYARKPHSYRELPIRYANTTMCYRDEQTGELAGLSRVRAFTQDDAHVFCRESQVKPEVRAIWDIVTQFYGTFGFELKLRLSKHDPASIQNYLGTAEVWQKAESQLESLLQEKKVDYIDGVGEAAFYGPKLDFLSQDALGRQWQIATIQLDFNLPERFDLAYTDEKGQQQRIVMIHAAIMGSLERLLAILIEHYAGSFPLWLSPIQAMIIPVSDKFNNYAEKHILKPLKIAGIRTEFNGANESVGKKIRFATLQKVPYMIIIGEKEIESNSMSVRSRDKGDLGTFSVNEFLKVIKREIQERQ